VGIFRRKQLVVLQHEVTGFVAEFNAGIVGGETRTWWVDSQPEWIMEGSAADE
jgi:hypothetical protein